MWQNSRGAMFQGWRGTLAKFLRRFRLSRTPLIIKSKDNMRNSNNKKREQLGDHIGTAASRLRKSIIFNLLRQLDQNYCFQCKEKIDNVNDLSIEHKIPWLDSEDPKKLFYDVNNIAFSHLSCNVRAARQTRTLKHPSQASYERGCRCDECKEEHRKNNEGWRRKKKEKLMLHTYC